MGQFFSNIWAWVTANAGVIAGVLTPANLILVIGAMISLFKQKKTIITSSVFSPDISKMLNENKAVRERADRLITETADLKALMGDLSDQLNQSAIKLNAVLDVQQSAYSSSNLPKETLVNINNYIAEGKLAERKTRQKITDELDNLKAKYKELSGMFEQADSNIKKLTNTASKPKDTAVKPSGVRL